MARIQKGALIPAVLATAAAAVFMATLYSKEAALSGRYETVRVLAARVDIPERTVLKDEYLETVEIPRRFVAQDAVEIRVTSDARLVAGLVARVRIPKGNQISQSTLTPLTSGAGLAMKVPPGYRGATVPIDPDLRPLVKPGDRVDVVVTFDAVMKDGRRQKVTATLLQNVLIIAVGGEMGPDSSAAAAGAAERAAVLSDRSSISVALNPLEFEYLSLAVQQGTTAVGVRGLGDGDMHPIEVASLPALFGGRPEP